MRWRIVGTICRKELLETIRDRRTMIIMLFIPVILYPVLLVGFSQIITHQVTKIQSMTGRVMVVGDIPRDLREVIRDNESLVLVDHPHELPIPEDFRIIPKAREKANGPTPAPTGQSEQLDYDPGLRLWAADLIKKRTVDAVLLAPKDFCGKIEVEGTGTAIVFYDETDDVSRSVNDRLWDILQQYKQKILTARRANHPELTTGYDRPLFVEMENVASAKRRGGYFAGRILPMMMIIMVMLGAFYPAVDITAGEKERGTMQTLMTAPALAIEIILGKFVTVAIISILSALANLGSMALAIGYLLESSEMGDKLNFQLDAGTGFILLLQLIPVAILFSALMLAVSIFAKSFKEAQNYLTPLYLIVIIPVVLTGLPGTDLTHFTAWIPILNVAILMKEILVQTPALELIGMVLLANLLYSMVALSIAVKIFQSEEVLLGGKHAISSAFRISGRRRHATPALSAGLFGGGLVVFFYLGSLMQGASLIPGLIASQYLLLLLPALLAVKYFKLNWRETLSLNFPPIRGVAGAILLGLSSWIILGLLAGWIQQQVLPEPPGYMEMMKKAMGINQADVPLALLLFAFAITPGICEEFFFRGPILAGFRNGLGKWPAILVTAVCFGIFHISIYRIFPTAVIGVVATLLVWQTRSIWCGVIFHAIHNGLLMVIMRKQYLTAWTSEKVVVFDWPQFIGFSICFILGLTLVLPTFSRSTLPSAEAESE